MVLKSGWRWRSSQITSISAPSLWSGLPSLSLRTRRVCACQGLPDVTSPLVTNEALPPRASLAFRIGQHIGKMRRLQFDRERGEPCPGQTDKAVGSAIASSITAGPYAAPVPGLGRWLARVAARQ